jgi:hypothetical protein
VLPIVILRQSVYGNLWQASAAGRLTKVLVVLPRAMAPFKVFVGPVISS